MSELALRQPGSRTPAVPVDPLQREGLSDEARRQLQDSVPDNTWNAYKAEWKKFATWCVEQGEGFLPSRTALLTNWVAERCALNHGPEAIGQGVSAVLFFHNQAGLKDTLDAEDCWRLITSHRRKRAAAGHRTRQAAVILLPELRTMNAALPEDRLSTLRDRAILQVGAAMFGRRSNIVMPDITDVYFRPDGRAEIFLAKSKTDQSAKGKSVVISPGSHPMSDPTGSLRIWVDALAEQGVTDGPLFRRISRSDRVLPYRLNAEWVNTLVHDTAEAAEMKPPPHRTYRAHSLRASGATMAWLAGKSVEEICRQGGWSVNSPVVYKYLRPEASGGVMDGVM